MDIFRVGAATEGNPLVAPAAGRVVLSYVDEGPGNDLGTGWNSIGDFLTAKPQF